MGGGQLPKDFGKGQAFRLNELVDENRSNKASFSFDSEKLVLIGGKELPSLLGYCEVYQMIVDVLREELKSNAQEFAV